MNSANRMPPDREPEPEPFDHQKEPDRRHDHKGQSNETEPNPIHRRLFEAHGGEL
jgi:hypothetical protein